MTADELRARILTALPGARVEITDLTGTSDHYEALVVAPQFAGRSRIEQHKLVYGALGAAVGNEIHALALKTLTPESQETERLK
ncbi:MAG: BolA family protein [Polyangiaceae bacterium]|jgi:stress-induced morphogen